MGGLGSDRKRAWKGLGLRPVAYENALALDIRELSRGGFIDTSVAPYGWDYVQSGETRSVEIEIENDWMYPRRCLYLCYVSDAEAFRQRVDLEETSCNFGGSRRWFLCPGCQGRCAILWWVQRFRCGRCQRVAYRSQNEDEAATTRRRIRKIRAKLKLGPTGFFPDRSDVRRMNGEKRLSLVNALVAQETRIGAIMLAKMAKYDPDGEITAKFAAAALGNRR